MKEDKDLLLMIEELKRQISLIKKNNIKKSIILDELNKYLKESINDVNPI